MANRDLNKCSKALKRVLYNGRRPVGIYLTNEQLMEIVAKNRMHSDGIWFLIGKADFEGKTRKTVELIPFDFNENRKPIVSKKNGIEGRLESINELVLNNMTDPSFDKEETTSYTEPMPIALTIPGQRTPPPRTI